MATLLLIGLNLIITLLFFRSADKPNFLYYPYQVARGHGTRGLFYSNFAHANWSHFFFNMLTLYFFAPVVLSGMGGFWLLMIYALSAVGADLAVFSLRRNDPGYACLGASGSVSGVLFAAIVLQPAMSLYMFFIPIPIPAPIFAIGYLALSFYLAKRGSDGISHEAHIGGAVTGFVLAALFSPGGLHPLMQRIGL